MYDVALAYDAIQGGWALPPGAAGAASVAIYCNGLRYHAGADFTIASGIVRPAADNMPIGSIVTADYDQ